MARDTISHRPIPTDDQAEALQCLAAYKKQNPAKYALKKEALFKRYGLDVQDEPEEMKDENDIELEELAKKVAKKAPKKKAVKKVTK